MARAIRRERETRAVQDLEQLRRGVLKELAESEQAAQDALSQIRAARLRSCRDLGYSD
jgi:hypothetical protein